jgi:hypothetical protein
MKRASNVFDEAPEKHVCVFLCSGKRHGARYPQGANMDLKSRIILRDPNVPGPVNTLLEVGPKMLIFKNDGPLTSKHTYSDVRFKIFHGIPSFVGPLLIASKCIVGSFHVFFTHFDEKKCYGRDFFWNEYRREADAAMSNPRPNPMAAVPPRTTNQCSQVVWWALRRTITPWATIMPMAVKIA